MGPALRDLDPLSFWRIQGFTSFPGESDGPGLESQHRSYLLLGAFPHHHSQASHSPQILAAIAKEEITHTRPFGASMTAGTLMQLL